MAFVPAKLLWQCAAFVNQTHLILFTFRRWCLRSPPRSSITIITYGTQHYRHLAWIDFTFWRSSQFNCTCPNNLAQLLQSKVIPAQTVWPLHTVWQCGGDWIVPWWLPLGGVSTSPLLRLKTWGSWEPLATSFLLEWSTLLWAPNQTHPPQAYSVSSLMREVFQGIFLLTFDQKWLQLFEPVTSKSHLHPAQM